MRLRELLNLVVKPRIKGSFGDILLAIPEFDDEPDEIGSSVNTKMDTLSGLSLIIEYENAKALRSQRVITCKQFSVEADVRYLKAYCHHRRAIRTFRIDRIIDVFDPISGECLSPVQGFFARYTPDKVARSGLSWGLSVDRRADLIALLNALVFLARCDREFHAMERACLERALSSFWLRLEIAGDPDFDDILAYSDRLSPDGETFWLAMHRIKENTIIATIFKRLAQMLIEADGLVRKEEVYWSIEIDEFLSDP